jgi:hypothetical protein
MFKAAFARRDAADYFGSVRDGLLGMEGSFLACEALDQNARVFVN